MDRFEGMGVVEKSFGGRSGDPSNQYAAASSTPFRGFDPLTVVPSLSGVRTSYCIASDRLEQIGKMGIAAMRAGVITESEMDGESGADVVLFDSFRNRVLDELRMSNMPLHLEFDFDSSAFDPYHELHEEDAMFASYQFSGDPSIRVVSNFVHELEAQFPGLGECLVYCLDVALTLCSSVFSPSYALSSVRCLEWCGCDDENEYLEEFGDEVENPEDIYTLDEFDRRIPSWMTRFKSKDYYEEILNSALRFGVGDSEIISLAASLLSAIEHYNVTTEVEVNKVESHFYIRACHDDNLFRFSDDIENHYMEASEGTHSCVIWKLTPHKSNLTAWLSDVKSHFALFRKAYRFMNRITEEGVYSHGYN